MDIYKKNKYKSKYLSLKNHKMMGGQRITRDSDEFNSLIYEFNHGVGCDILKFFSILLGGILKPLDSGIHSTVTPDKISLGSLNILKHQRSSFYSYLPLQFFVKRNESIVHATHEGHVPGEYYSLININKEDIVPVIDINFASKKYEDLILSYGFNKYKANFNSFYIKTAEKLKEKIEIQLMRINELFAIIGGVDFRLITYEEIHENCTSMRNINTYVHNRIGLFFENNNLMDILNRYFRQELIFIYDSTEDDTIMYRECDTYEYDDILRIK